MFDFHSIVAEIIRAESRIYDLVSETPLNHAPLISKKINNNVYLKREDLQPIFSFKLRGAYNKLIQLHQDEKGKNVVAASAGNHAQGVAMAARKLGFLATIIMPVTTPEIKSEAVKNLGASVLLKGNNYDESAQYAKQYAEKNQCSYVPPFDDKMVIAGQGTVAAECLRQLCNIDYIFVPVGGGGLLAGITAYVHFINPKIKLISVEFEKSASLKYALEEGLPKSLEHVGVFADGIAVKKVGELPFDILRDSIHDAITVSADEICAATKDIFTDCRSVPEPSGAVALAGLKQYVSKHGLFDQNCIAIVSGANVSFEMLRSISDRAEIGESKEALFVCDIPEKQGSFIKFIKHFYERKITEFNYRWGDEQRARVIIGFHKINNESNDLFCQVLNAEGYTTHDVSGDNLVGFHIRHMVGGRVEKTINERIFRFEFPEKSGSLKQFLELTDGMNITLFHYRNQGMDTAQVLVGFENLRESLEEFRHRFIHFPCFLCEETNNITYLKMLRK